jgi:hypothetical protein
MTHWYACTSCDEATDIVFLNIPKDCTFWPKGQCDLPYKDDLACTKCEKDKG